MIVSRAVATGGISGYIPPKSVYLNFFMCFVSLQWLVNIYTPPKKKKIKFLATPLIVSNLAENKKGRLERIISFYGNNTSVSEQWLCFVYWQRATVILTRVDVVSTLNCSCCLEGAAAEFVCAVDITRPADCVSTAVKVITVTAADPSTTAELADVRIYRLGQKTGPIWAYNLATVSAIKTCDTSNVS